MQDTKEERLQHKLAYNEVSMGIDGQVLTDDKKKKLREKRGYCLECRGPPIMLFTIKKSRMNPLFTTKKPRNVEGLCAGGICFVCYPYKDPNQKKNRNMILRGKVTPASAGGRRSIPVISSQLLNAVQQRTPSPSVTPRRISEPPMSPQLGDADQGNTSRHSVPIPSIPRIDLDTHSDDSVDTMEDSIASRSQEFSVSARDASAPVTEVSHRQYSSDSVLPSMSIMDEPSRRPGRSGHDPSRRQSDTSQPTVPPSSSRPNQQQLMESMRNDRMSMTEAPQSTRTTDLSPTRNGGSSRKARTIDRSPTRNSGSSRQARTTDLSPTRAGGASQPTRATGASQPARTSDLSSTRTSDYSSFSDSYTGLSENMSFPDTREAAIAEEDVQAIISELDSLLSDLLKIPGAEELVAQTIVGALREHQGLEEVLIYLLKTIWESGKDNDVMKREVMKLNVPEDIVKAMTRFSKSAKLQEVGCGAIWSLAIKAENRHSFIKLGSCAIIMTALDRFTTNENLVSAAIGAARTLSPEDDAREPLRLAEGSRMVAKGMRAHPTSSIIQRDGCAFLSNAAVDMKAQYVTVVSKLELETVLGSMRHHRNDPAVVAGACFALKNYTVDENNCRTLRQIDTAMELIQHAAGFIASPECMEDAEDILESMQFAQTLDNSIEDEAYATFSSTVEIQINLPGFVNRVLEFMEENDWSPRLTCLGLQTYGRVALSSPDHKEHVYNKTNLSRIVQFAKNLQEDSSVCLEACNLFGILAGEENQRATLVSVGACDVIFHSLTFQRNQTLIRSSLQALELLASTNAGNCLALIRRKTSAIREALEANQTSDSIMMSAIAILSLVE